MEPQQLNHIDRRLDRIEQKLDNHLERVARVEEGLSSARGYIKWILSAAIAIVSAVLTGIIHYLTGGK